MYIYTYFPMNLDYELTKEEELIYCNLQDYAKSAIGEYVLMVSEAEALDYEIAMFEDFAERENIDMDALMIIYEKVGLRRDRGFFTPNING